MAKEKKRRAGAQLGRKKNMNVRSRQDEEIRIFCPAPEVLLYVKEQIKKTKESKSLVAGKLLEEGIEYRKSKEQAN